MMRALRPATAIALLAAGSLALSPAQAEDAAPKDKVPESLAEFVGFSSPAFSLIGAADASVVRPETPQALATSLLNGLDEEGNLKNGLAIEFAPLLLFAPRSYDLADYQKQSGLSRSITNLQVSMGFVKGASDDDKSLRASIGLVWTPINGRDVKAPGARNACFNAIPLTPAYRPPGAADPNDPDGSIAREKKEQAIAKCKTDHPLRRDNTTTLQFGFAPLFVSPTGSTNGLKSQGYAASGTLSLGLTGLFGPAAAARPANDKQDRAVAERRALFVLTGLYRKKEIVADPAVAGAFLTRDRWSVGSRLQFGLGGSSYLGIEGAYQRAKYADGRRDKFEAVIATYDFKVSKELWLGLNVGSSFDKLIGKDAAFVGTKLKWSFIKSSNQGGLFD